MNERCLIPKQIFNGAIIAFLIAIFLPCESYASEAFVSEMCNLYNISTGNAGKALAAFAIISVGVGFFTGKVSWGLMVGVSMGVATMAGAPSIVSAISGQSTFVCEEATYNSDCADGASCDSCPTGRTGLTCQDYLPGYSSASASGCDEASGYTKIGASCYKSCSLSERGISQTTVTHASDQTTTCNAANFGGSLTYTCDNGTLKNVVNNCVCTGHFSGTNCERCFEGYVGSQCDSCDSASYTMVGSSCQKDCTTTDTNTISGIPTGQRLLATSGTYTCSSPYANAVDYSCVEGILNFSSTCSMCQTDYKMISGACVPNCIINTTGNTIVAGVSATSLDATANGETGTKTCDVSGYRGSLSYTCNTRTPTIITPCAIRVSCTGGTPSTITDSVSGVSYNVHTFTSSGTLDCTQAGSVQVLVVAGGGAGSPGYNSAGGSGGGAGGVLYSDSFSISSTSYTVTVGSGGIPKTTNTGTDYTDNSSNGTNSSFSTLSATGGGAGGVREYNGRSGGSGGGGGITASSRSGGAGISGQGNSGGANYTSNQLQVFRGGGGGGAGGVGTSGTATTGGNGGAGKNYNISGTDVYYGGGGAGSYYNTCTPNGLPGIGGGGAVGSAGAANTGGGGGGAVSASTFGGAGGSGIVIVRYVN